MTGPVEQLLAATPAHDLLGGVAPRGGGPLPWSFAYGPGAAPGAHGTSIRRILALLPIFLVGGFGAVWMLFMVLSGPIGTPELLGTGLFSVVLLGLAWPHLRRRSKGVLLWERRVVIDADRVRVTDKDDTDTTLWDVPVSSYRDVHHRVVRLGAGDASFAGGTRRLELDIVELRHPEPGKTLYLRGTKRNMLGGMSLSEMIQAGREGRRGEVEAAVGSAVAPELQAYVEDIAARLSLLVTRDAEAQKSVAP